MKHIIKCLGSLLAVVLLSTAFTACSDDDLNGSANVGLGIKVFFPTKVVTNQPITINGSGFNSVNEIEFPGGIKVTSFETVNDQMIRVNAPAGIAPEGGKIVVRTADDQTESRLPLTVGHTVVSGFSKQPGETATGGELITVFGTDLEFINKVELLDADSVTQFIDHKDFYRKGTSNVIFRVPAKNIYDGTFVGYVHTYDGQRIPMPELTYEPASSGGHFETVKTIIWKNDGQKGTIDWGNVNCRFAMDGHDGNNECVATFPEDVWEKMKTSTFYILCRPDADWYQIRITNGWWDTQWMGADNDISPNNMADRMIDNGDGTFYVEINFGDDPIVGTLDEKHLLFTGAGYTLEEIYFQEEIWIEGDEGSGDAKNTFWKNDGQKGTIDWGNVNCRFALDGHDGNNECIATFPEDVWNIIKTGTFYAVCKADADWYQIRITNGWWDTQWMGADNDISPNNMADRMVDNGDGTFYIEINFGDDPIVGTLDEKHLLFTGAGYTLLELYYK
jgi:predicted RNA-binding protein with PUA-like domain